jgi:hypothetical protein
VSSAIFVRPYSGVEALDVAVDRVYHTKPLYLQQNSRDRHSRPVALIAIQFAVQASE